MDSVRRFGDIAMAESGARFSMAADQIGIIVEAATIPSVTALGCITAYVYCQQKEMRGSHDFLKRFFPNRSDAFYLRTDFAMSAIIGTVIGIILYSPHTAYQALAAGLGWTAAFNVVSASKRSHPLEPKPDGEKNEAEPKPAAVKPRRIKRSGVAP